MTYAGVMCGIMDQFASLFGRDGHVVRLDCRSLDYEYFPFDTTAYRIVLCNSGVKHSLASSEYNTRRQECEQRRGRAPATLPSRAQPARRHPGTSSKPTATELGDVVFRRCSYVVRKTSAWRRPAGTSEAGDMAAFGQEMYGSHAGLRDDYEVSCASSTCWWKPPEPLPGVFGARMMGGGFGGCTINLVATEQVDEFVASVSAALRGEVGLELETYQTTIVGGVERADTVARAESN